MQNDFARNTRSFEPSICLVDFTQSDNNLDDFQSVPVLYCIVAISVEGYN